MQSPQSPYMSIKEAAEILGMTPQAIYAWLKEAKFEHLKIEGKSRANWRILRADFQQFIEDSTVKKAAPKKAGRPPLLRLEKSA